MALRTGEINSPRSATHGRMDVFRFACWAYIRMGAKHFVAWITADKRVAHYASLLRAHFDGEIGQHTPRSFKPVAKSGEWR
jgi:hypothetical protein